MTFTIVREPNRENLRAADDVWMLAREWQLWRETIHRVFRENPGNNDKVSVAAKAAVLDRLYYTNVKNLRLVVDRIVAQLDFDERLKQGDTQVIDDVFVSQQSEDRPRLISFASKYAFFHYPDVYPIYDRYIWKAVKKLVKPRQLPERPASYGFFFSIMEQFRKSPAMKALTWRQFDEYFWVYGQKLALDKEKNKSKAGVESPLGEQNQEPLSKEVRRLYGEYPRLFGKLEPEPA